MKKHQKSSLTSSNWSWAPWMPYTSAAPAIAPPHCAHTYKAALNILFCSFSLLVHSLLLIKEELYCRSSPEHRYPLGDDAGDADGGVEVRSGDRHERVAQGEHAKTWGGQRNYVVNPNTTRVRAWKVRSEDLQTWPQICFDFVKKSAAAIAAPSLSESALIQQ